MRLRIRRLGVRIPPSALCSVGREGPEPGRIDGGRGHAVAVVPTLFLTVVDRLARRREVQVEQVTIDRQPVGEPVLGPLRIDNGTGSPVNPIALF
jgi:hypothetical protein